MDSRYRSLPELSAFGVFLAVFIICLIMVNPSIPPSGNSGELVISGVSLGVPHPTGYPTYTIISHLFLRVLPVGNIVYRASVVSALFLAMGMTILFLFLRILNGGKFFIPFIVTLSTVLVSTVCSQGLLPEVYSFHILFMSLAMYLGQRITMDFRSRYLNLLSFVSGFAFTNHILFIFMAPLLVIWLGGTLGWHRLKKIKFVPVVIFFVAGLSIYLYLPVRSSVDPVMDWGNTESAVMFLKHLSGSQFHGNMFGLPAPVFIRNLERILRWWWAGIPFYITMFSLMGILAGLRRWLVIAVLVTCVLMIIGIANYDIPDIENYYAGLVLLAAIPVVYGIRVLVAIVSDHRYVRTTFYILLFAAVTVFSLDNCSTIKRRNHYLGLDYGRTLFSGLEENSIVITSGDLPNNLMGYLHIVEQYYPGIKFFDATGNFFTNGDINKKVKKSDDFTNLLQRLVLRDRTPVYLTFWPGFNRVYDLDIIQDHLLYHISRVPDDDALNVLDYKELLPLRGLVSDEASRDPSLRELVCEYYIYRAHWYHERQCFDNSLFMMQSGSLEAGDIPHLHARLGFFLDLMDWPREAVFEYQRAIELDPYFTDALNNIANIYLQEYGQIQEATMYCTEALNSIPNARIYDALRVQCLDTLARIYEMSGSGEKTLEVIERMQRIDPQNRTTYLQRKNSLEQKIKDVNLLRSKSTDPDMTPRKLVQQAMSFHRMGYLPEAIKEYSAALKGDPENIRTLNNLAVAYTQIGWIENAADMAERILSINPRIVSAHQILGIYYGKNHQISKAVSHLQMMLKETLSSSEKDFAETTLKEYRMILDKQCPMIMVE